MRPKPKFYSRDLEDAIGLASCSLEEGPLTWYARADFHIRDIARYDSKHPSIKLLRSLEKQALKYIQVQDRTVNKLRQGVLK